MSPYDIVVYTGAVCFAISIFVGTIIGLAYLGQLVTGRAKKEDGGRPL